MAEEKTTKPASDGADKKPAAKAKKEKPPAPEEKPFSEFITQHFIPSLEKSLTEEGVSDLDLKLEKKKMPVPDSGEEYWQVAGTWKAGQRQFAIGFSKEDIKSPKFFCAADNGSTPSTLESFMIDERRVNLDLMVLYTLQRLDGQKWLSRN